MKKDKKKKKKKRDKSASTETAAISPIAASEDDVVMLGVRMRAAEREKIKLYALTQHTTVALLIRQYIASLPEAGRSS